jgi:CDP-diacylglycerol--glycerol-3-phosphate 3-phosphatidyltransferase
VPNLITLLRILIVPFFFTALLYYEPTQDYLRGWALILFLAASLTDAIDGLVARLRKEISQLGKFLDPLADKLLLISAYLGILFAKDFPLAPPLWVVVAIVFRDLVILGGLSVLYIAGASVEVRPNFLGKLTTALQMAAIISILLLLPLSPFLWYVTAVLTIVSGFIYVAREMHRLRKATR